MNLELPASSKTINNTVSAACIHSFWISYWYELLDGNSNFGFRGHECFKTRYVECLNNAYVLVYATCQSMWIWTSPKPVHNFYVPQIIHDCLKIFMQHILLNYLIFLNTLEFKRCSFHSMKKSEDFSFETPLEMLRFGYMVKKRSLRGFWLPRLYVNTAQYKSP